MSKLGKDAEISEQVIGYCRPFGALKESKQ